MSHHTILTILLLVKAGCSVGLVICGWLSYRAKQKKL